MKEKRKTKIQRIAEAVATIRAVDCTHLFSPVRESEKVASARTLAMGACLGAGISLAETALEFGRSWRTVYNAEKSCQRRRRNSSRFTDEWETVIATTAKQSPECPPAIVP